MRKTQWFDRCPSCGAFKSCFGWLDPKRKALTLPASANPWEEEIPQQGSAGYGGNSAGGGYGSADGVSEEGGYDEDGDEEDGDEDEEIIDRQGQRLVLPKVKLLSRVKPTELVHAPSGYEPFDEVTAGGAVQGTVSGWTAFPGVGKSTFLLEALAGYAATGVKVAYGSVEESSGDISKRAERLGLYDRYKGSRKNLLIIAAEATDPDQEISDEAAARAIAQSEALSNVRAMIAAADKRGAKILVVDSASRMHSKEVRGTDKRMVGGKNKQLVHVVKTCYHRAHRLHEYKGFSEMTIFVILHSTKNGDSNVPQEFIHDLDSTFVGEHVMVKETKNSPPEIDAAPNQKKPTGMIWFRSHGKNRGGDVMLRTFCHMTARGVSRVGNEEEAIEYARELRKLQKQGLSTASAKLSPATKTHAPLEPAPATKNADGGGDVYSLAGDDGEAAPPPKAAASKTATSKTAKTSKAAASKTRAPKKKAKKAKKP